MPKDAAVDTHEHGLARRGPIAGECLGEGDREGLAHEIDHECNHEERYELASLGSLKSVTEHQTGEVQGDCRSRAETDGLNEKDDDGQSEPTTAVQWVSHCERFTGG